MIVSIFYNRSLWNDLLTQVIKPFIFIEEKKDSIESWCIYLSDIQGDHITLVVNSSDEQLEVKFSNLAVEFLKANPSEKDTVKYPLQGFFMDYPNNSIVFNKDKPFVNAFNQKERTVEQEISKSLIKAFDGDLVNTESTCTFLIYMQFGMMKAAFPDIRLIANDDILQGLKFDSSMDSAFTASTKQDESFFMELIENNKDIIPEIIHDIWNSDKTLELEWLYDWVFACKNFINRDNFKERFIKLSYLLCNQLGLNEIALIPVSCQMIRIFLNELYEV